MNTITIEVEGLWNDDVKAMTEFLQYRLKGSPWPDGFLYRDYCIEDGHYAWASARVVEVALPLSRQRGMNPLVVPFDELPTFSSPHRSGQVIGEINAALSACDDEERATCWDARLIPVEEVAA